MVAIPFILLYKKNHDDINEINHLRFIK
uniref:Uncharacterized protein n=1 Tax=Heterorhabditis bacteriophora TaxID=37862 RepID=A0A1I7WPG9_HETBA